MFSTRGGSCLGTTADHLRRHLASGRYPAGWQHPGRAQLAASGLAVGPAAGGRLAGPGRAAGVVRPRAGRAAGQPRRDRVPDRGAGPGGRPGRPPVGRGARMLPRGSLACRRLGLGRLAAYGVAMVAALVPAGFFYSEYAMTDAIFPVLTLAWLLTVHSWLTAASARARYAAAVGSALLSGFAYAVHSRGLIMLVVYAVVGIVIGVRRQIGRASVAAAGLTALLTAGAGWSMDRYLTAAIYPDGIRSLTGQLLSRLTSSYGAVHVAEMAGGQMWRLTLDSWGLAGLGLIAALAAILRRELRTDLRIMAAICVAVTILIACVAPAALPPDQSQTWASGRYLDGMIVTFFLVGAVVLLRAGIARILGYAAATAGLTVLAAATVAVYAGTSLPATGFGDAFNFAEPAVLAQDWTQASVLVATAVALGLLACWVVLALIRRPR